jgi:hypothetical protein
MVLNIRLHKLVDPFFQVDSKKIVWKLVMIGWIFWYYNFIFLNFFQKHFQQFSSNLIFSSCFQWNW